MLTEGAWRKLPKDLLVDEDFAYVESLLPPEYSYAPYMLYISALRKADDNGIFDVEDMVIFARLMRVPNTEIVKTTLNGFFQRKIFFREGLSTICGFRQWEHGEGSNKPRTLQDRRRIVQDKIKEKENEKKSSMFATDSTRPEQTQNAPAENCNDNPQEQKTQSFDELSLCPENDKNAENVTKNIYGDKIGENVTKKNETERKKERETRNTTQEEKERTHTLEQREERKTEKEGITGSGQNASPPPVIPEDKEAVAVESQEQQDLQDSKETVITADSVESLAEAALNITQNEVDEKKEALVAQKLTKFFVKNCYGYDKKQGAHSVNKLAERICKVSDEMNPADSVCDVLCNEFKRLSETGGPNGYWKDIPLLPSNMVKNNVWAYLMSYAGKILATNRADNQFIQEERAARQAAVKEKSLVGDTMEQQFLKYNINPEDPGRYELLLRAKSAEQKAQNAEKQESSEVTDIF